MADHETDIKPITFLPYQMARLLDSNTFKILSILISLRNIDPSKMVIQVPLSKLVEYSGMSQATIQASIKALCDNEYITFVSTAPQFNDNENKYEYIANKYSINDQQIWDCLKIKWEILVKKEQVKSSKYNYTHHSKPVEKKPKKADIIRPMIDISKSAEDNLSVIRDNGIDISLALVSRVLKENRERMNYSKVKKNKPNESELYKTVTLLEQRLSALENLNVSVDSNSKERGEKKDEQNSREDKIETPFKTGSGGSYLFGDKSKWSLTKEEAEQEFLFRCDNKLPMSEEWANFVADKLGLKNQ